MGYPLISTEDISYRKRISLLGTNMAYVDVGEGDPIIFLHGNPTPSYLWRNIIPYLLPFGRCLAPDYIGMGNSGQAPDGSYRFVDHQRYLDAWFDIMGLQKNIILPIEGQPQDVVKIVDEYAHWLSQSPIPKLFIDGDPGGFLIGAQREFCKAWPNQQTVTVKGAHFLQEDSPVEIGEAIARFIANVLAKNRPSAD